ncbi:hypothetical protein Landi51_10055 [Colletotrichum acutatum]
MIKKSTQKVGNGYRNSPTHPRFDSTTLWLASILSPYPCCSPSSKVPQMRVTSSHRPSTYRQSGSPTSGKAPNVASRRDSAARADPAAAIHGSAGFPSLLTGHHHRRRRPRRRLRSIAVANLRLTPISPLQSNLPPVVPFVKRLHRDVRELPLGQTSVQALIRRPAASLRTRGYGFAALQLAPVLTSRPCAAPPSHCAIRRSTLVQPTWCHSLPPPLVNVQRQPEISSSASNCTQRCRS